MKSILVKFYSVKKYGVAVFLAAASFFSFAMDCNVSEPFQSGGKWYVTVSCYGTVGGEYDVEVEYGGGSGGEGGSTNCGCTAMSPSACNQIKTDLLTIIETSKASASANIGTLDIIRQSISDTFSELQALEADPYILYGSNDGISNYYNQSVLPAISQIATPLSDAFVMLDVAEYDNNAVVESLDEMNQFVIGIDCSPCTSSGGGGSDSPSNPSGGCPCSEVLQAIKHILTEHKENLLKIKERLDGWDKYLKQITTSVNSLAFMGTNFNFAVKYKTLDGVTFTMRQLDDKFLSKKSATFDYQEFGNLSWYSRIEYLLMSIAGVFSKTNREDELTISKLDSAYSDITDREETLQNQVTSLETKFGSLHSAISGLMSAFSSAVGSGSSSGTVTLMASWFGGRGLVMTIPDNVISTSRVVFSLLWTVIFTFTMYQIVLNGWVFIVKFIQFWITQTTGFLK